MEKEMVSDRHNQYVPLPCFRHERFKVSLMAADVNLFMPTVIFSPLFGAPNSGKNSG